MEQKYKIIYLFLVLFIDQMSGLDQFFDKTQFLINHFYSPNYQEL